MNLCELVCLTIQDTSIPTVYLQAESPLRQALAFLPQVILVPNLSKCNEVSSMLWCSPVIFFCQPADWEANNR